MKHGVTEVQYRNFDVTIKYKVSDLTKVDCIASIMIFTIIWYWGCAIVFNFPEMHDAYKMLIGYFFGTVGAFASGMHKH